LQGTGGGAQCIGYPEPQIAAKSRANDQTCQFAVFPLKVLDVEAAFRAESLDAAVAGLATNSKDMRLTVANCFDGIGAI